MAYKIDINKLKLLGRNKSESIILKTGTDNGNIAGWLITTKAQERNGSKAGSYGKNWNTDFVKTSRL